MIPRVSNKVSRQRFIDPNVVLDYIGTVDESELGSFVSGRRALEVRVYTIMHTQPRKYVSIPNDVGFDAASFIGKPFSYYQARLEDAVREALMYIDEITMVTMTRLVERNSTVFAEFVLENSIGSPIIYRYEQQAA